MFELNSDTGEECKDQCYVSVQTPQFREPSIAQSPQYRVNSSFGGYGNWRVLSDEEPDVPVNPTVPASVNEPVQVQELQYSSVDLYAEEKEMWRTDEIDRVLLMKARIEHRYKQYV